MGAEVRADTVQQRRASKGPFSGSFPSCIPWAQPAQGLGTGAMVLVQWRGTATSREAQRAPLNCPVLFMEIMHPDTLYTPWISMQPRLCYPAAARLLEVPLVLAVVSITLPNSARLLLCGASPHVHASRPPGCKDARVSWCPNLAPSPGGSTVEALPGIPKSGFALAGQELGGSPPSAELASTTWRGEAPWKDSKRGEGRRKQRG